MDETLAVSGMSQGVYNEAGDSLAGILGHPTDYAA